MILVGMILVVWFGLAFLTVAAINVWKFVVMGANKSSVNLRSAQRADQLAAG